MTTKVQSRAGYLRACSVIAIGCSSVVVSNPASAACSPDPTLESSTTICAGTDADGLTVTTNATTVLVEDGASVSPSSGPAITVAIDAPISVSERTATIQVNGSVDGGSSAGIALTEGTLLSGYWISTETDITVGETGSVTGSHGILLGPVTEGTGYTFGTLDNAGTISGTAGAAVLSQGRSVTFTEVTNRSTGTIYGLSGAFGTIDNAGLIDGSSGSAIALSGQTQAYSRAITNSGSIVSSGLPATIDNLNMEITNSGEIANTGSGAAISGSSDYYVRVTNNIGGTITSAQGSTLTSGRSLSLTNAGTVANLGTGMVMETASAYIKNEAGGTIRSTGTAISVSETLTLINEGTIIGDILAGSSSNIGIDGSNVDSTKGTITGDLIFGAGQDVLHALYTDEGELVTGVTGAIDGGAGSDLVQLDFTADRTLDAEIVLPTNFENIVLAASSGVTVTLADGFSSADTMVVGGPGTVRNETSLTGDGVVISTQWWIVSGRPSLENAGTITSAGMSGDYALDLSPVDRFSNSGTIVSQGGGVNLYTYEFTNSGAIDAVDTAVKLHISGPAVNSGTIHSSDGIGMELSGSYGDALTNSGTIEGKAVGVALGAALINTGTIFSSGTGIALSNSGILDNRAGATVTGDVMAIAPASSRLWNARVYNAGVIEGDVSFGQTYASFYGNNNTFYALEGGILNGNLALGNGDFLVTSINNKGDGDFAGINGTVSASNSHLRYEVNSDTSALLALPQGFSSVGFQLHDDAALTLKTDETYTSQLLVSGVGSVDLTLDIEVIDTGALSGTAMISAYEYSSESRALNVISHGMISATIYNPKLYPAAAVVLGSNDVFTNTGTVTLTDLRDVTYNTLSAIWNASVINTGTITANGGTGIYGSENIENSGIITASGLAIDGYENTLVTNSGTISSTGSAAIQFTYGYNSSIANTAEGIITGEDGVAIQSSGGTVRNAGKIVGDVNLGWSSYGYSATSGTYFADGGTIEGDLLFGSGSDILIETGSGFGVSGTIDGGNGDDSVGHVLPASGTVALGGDLPTGFEHEFAGSLGSDTVTTITSEAMLEHDLLVAGNGQIVNQASTKGSLTGFYFSSNSELLADLKAPLASLVNEADVAGGISLNVVSLTNTGMIGSDIRLGAAVYQTATGQFAFANSGTIAAGMNYSALTIYATDLASGSFTNSGSITGADAVLAYRFAEDAELPNLSFTNSGTMTLDRGVLITNEGSPNTYSLTIANSGTISSSYWGSAALNLEAGGSGTIRLSNGGTIGNDGSGYSGYFYNWTRLPDGGFAYVEVPITGVASAISIEGDSSSAQISTIVNAGTIRASGSLSTAIRTRGGLDLTNTGTISGSVGFVLADNDRAALEAGTTRFAGAIQTFGEAADTITNSGTISGSIDLGSGNDAIANTGTIAGDVWLGAGDDTFTQLLSAVFDGTADGGDGLDTLAFDITGGGTLSAASFAPFINFEAFRLTGTGEITTNGVMPVETLQIASGASFELAAGSTLQTQGSVALTGSDGAETLINHGLIIGDVVLGGGDDTYEFYSGSSVTGTVNGGAGYDRLAFYLAGSDQARDTLDLAPYTSFEEFVMGSGTGEYAGEVAFDSVSVEGGRLIGAAGSTLRAPGGIRVARGATFGSAGTVIGNVDVAGTLSPGASPGTMTIDGDLSLASGSTTYFEMTEAQSDAILVLGSTTIANRATLELSGRRAYKAGTPAYTLISSIGGISGSFATITKSSQVYGFVRQEGESLVLTNTLLAPAGASAPLTATVARINAMMEDGSGSEAFYAAVPTLADIGGRAFGAAIATLHPEAYASAAQVGIDDGLAIASAVRSDIKASGARAGLFAMGMGLGASNQLAGRAGTSDADNDLGGMLAGLGYRFQNLTVAAFGGRAYGHQSISALGTRTSTSGTFVGGTLGYSVGSLQLGSSVIWDASSATTRRALFDASLLESTYDLHSLTFDGYAAYSFGLGSTGWKAGPQLTLSHVRTNRAGAQESGSEVFGLQVSARDHQATFVSADVRFELDRQTRVQPNLMLGVQQRVSGDALRASAAFGGSSKSFTVAGAMREKTLAHVGAGVNWAASQKIEFFAQGEIHFNAKASAETVNAGIRVLF
ncbi:hypothetical protein [Aurantiacibacter suaedae]|uniref:hypothetical protein n=1 Tax=Aurantiacibacter suaedae TaxID=2545755 RepID=UPI0010F83FF8|nr:hypothetical protein [Aurantiacibacter suaedae]